MSKWGSRYTDTRYMLNVPLKAIYCTYFDHLGVVFAELMAEFLLQSRHLFDANESIKREKKSEEEKQESLRLPNLT